MCRLDAFPTASPIEEKLMTLLPIFLNLAGRRCLLVGAGTVALDKVGSLLKTGLQLRIVAPEARPEIEQLALEGKVEWVARAFVPADLDGNFVVIAATDVAEVNADVYKGAVQRGILCNSVDDIPHCDFFFGSVVNRGDLQIAISTAGESPALAQRLRREIDAQLPADLGPWLGHLGDLRREVLATHPRSEERKALLHQLAQRPLCESATCPSRQLVREAIGDASAELAGKVFLVGAGPGDPDLLTVKALRLIQSATVILHDDLVPQTILAMALQAEIVNVGKRCGAKNITQEEIHALLIGHAREGRVVVRLKAGDPLIFGRAAEEMAALRQAGIEFEVVPGITSAFAAAAAIPCSFTDRNSASNVVFSTGHHAQSHHHSPLPQIEDATRVVYMPGRDLQMLAEEWLHEGLPSDFPCAIVSRAAQPGQQIHHTTLGRLGASEAVEAPSMVLAGWAIARSGAPTVQFDEIAATA
jgi:uroporphyrin-III C-methyltransferase/precorrin-2 dehydrogenase/sirohydrochlorin ferrochelatase